jgi:mannan endo-1,4-beta-mannosidase
MSSSRTCSRPGTALYNHWCAQVDEIAGYLKQLQDAHVPVLWRPYHEMNGDWFWWGNRTGQYSTIALYKQLFDRLVNHHHLNNLVWVWSMDRPSTPGREHEFLPGADFVDVLALDVYGNDFAQSYYDSLVALSQGKPIALAEVGNPPTPEILSSSPGGPTT